MHLVLMYMYMLLILLLFLLDELLLNRQVKDYAFLAKGCVSVDDVDDADMFKQTEVDIDTIILYLNSLPFLSFSLRTP